MSAPTELFKGNAELLILSCLSRCDMHGYRIVRELEDLSEGYFTMREGTLYPHLHALEREGFIEGYWETGARGRERKSYRITERGAGHLARKRGVWNEFGAKVTRVLDAAPEPSR